MPSIEELARKNGGAIEVSVAREKPLMVFLAGPIACWWEPGMWDSPEHQEYIKWRDAIEYHFVSNNFLVYKPYTAWRGSWHESAQKVNNLAIEMCDLFIVLTPEGVTAKGTEYETHHAKVHGKQIKYWPVGDPKISDFLESYNA